MDKGNEGRPCDTHEVPKKNEKLMIECGDCGNKEYIQADKFDLEKDNDSNIMLTDSIFARSRRQLLGWIIGLFIALLAGLILADIFAPRSGIPTWILFVSAVVWMSSASVINRFVAKDLPVWSLLCSNCKKRNHVASDGKTSFLLKYK